MLHCFKGICQHDVYWYAIYEMFIRRQGTVTKLNVKLKLIYMYQRRMKLSIVGVCVCGGGAVRISVYTDVPM